MAAAAVLNIVDPAMTGIGGDMFCLYYDASANAVRALNGSGRSPAGATLEDLCRVLEVGDPKTAQIPAKSIHAITIPGAAGGWVDTVESFGSKKLSLFDILSPAIEMAEEGVPISKVASYFVGKNRVLPKCRTLITFKT